jgi:hypothetical protein
MSDNWSKVFQEDDGEKVVVISPLVKPSVTKHLSRCTEEKESRNFKEPTIIKSFLINDSPT